ncbi:hypothetical protein [Nigerium massiliense]|uniref:hypothetical protein n=1 Tax=Nigerium massiliense TaxID=1522317 RepID=UPI000590CB1A|nr:hypothetical protein [Nigerium massiliense]
MSQSTLPRTGPSRDDDEQRFTGELVLTAEDAPRRAVTAPALVALGSFAFVTASVAVATWPGLAETGQLIAALPVLLGVAAPGLGPVATWLAETFSARWRLLLPLAAYPLTLLLASGLPGLDWPAWLAPLVGALCAAPLYVAGTTGDGFASLVPEPGRVLKGGTAMAALAVVALVFCAGADLGLWTAILEVMLVVGLVAGALNGTGLANAASRWRPRHWLALGWGALLTWGVLLARAVVPVLPWWVVLVAAVAAGVPLLRLARR